MTATLNMRAQERIDERVEGHRKMTVTSPAARATRTESGGQVEQKTLSLAGNIAEMCAACEKCREKDSEAQRWAAAYGGGRGEEQPQTEPHDFIQ